ncbi:hypothetical protein RF11_09935 [Thelohanellus kitauei]|uniref:Uncharacterized protein n=1 Tax=Thelohanellus kitauei TaxID=669202 RepID=A0A0C2IMV9_THEKT|nr:hypothetical protein RF11_09935 [Thelohanellus kitauei]
MRIIDILQSKIYLEKTKVKPFSINPYVITIKNFQNYTLDESQVKRWIAPYVEKIDQISIVDRNNDVIFKDKRFTQALEPSVYVFCQTRVIHFIEIGKHQFFPQNYSFYKRKTTSGHHRNRAFNISGFDIIVTKEYSNPTYDGSKEAVEFLNFLKTKRLVNLNEKIECLEKVEEIVRKTSIFLS